MMMKDDDNGDDTSLPDGNDGNSPDLRQLRREVEQGKVQKARNKSVMKDGPPLDNGDDGLRGILKPNQDQAQVQGFDEGLRADLSSPELEEAMMNLNLG